MENAAGAKPRIEYYDIAKGIGILLVVWAHGRGPFSNYIYQFHMPLFFLISGLLYSEAAGVGEFIKRKVKSLYLPFVIWNLLFYVTKSILHHVKSDTIVDTALRIVLTLDKDGQYFGATWFMGSLFVVAVLYKLLEASLRESPSKDITLLLTFGALAVLGYSVTLPHMVSRTLVLSLCYAVGAFCKKHQEKITLMQPDHWLLAVGSVVFFYFAAKNNSANMGANEYRHPLLFAVESLLMSYALLYLCKYAEKLTAKPAVAVKRVLVFLSRRSVDILIWQFVAFRLVIAAQMLLHHEALTVKNLLAYYPVYDAGGLWWLVYTVVGIVGSLLWCDLLRLGPWGKLLKKIHAV